MKQVRSLLGIIVLGVLTLVILSRLNQSKRESYIPRASEPVATTLISKVPIKKSSQLVRLSLGRNNQERPDFEEVSTQSAWTLQGKLLDIRDPLYRTHLYEYYEKYLSENQTLGLLLTDLGSCQSLEESISCPDWWELSEKELVAELRQRLSTRVLFFETIPELNDEKWELNRHYFLTLDGVVAPVEQLNRFKKQIKTLVPDSVYRKKSFLEL